MNLSGFALTHPQQAHTRRGIVYLEVLMALFPILLTFLGICQLALLYAGKLVVQHAATRAARAAIVVLEEPPERYEDAARGDLVTGSANTEQEMPEEVQELLGIVRNNPLAAAREEEGDESQHPSSSRHQRGNARNRSGRGEEDTSPGARWGEIAAAAYHPLSVLAPPLRFSKTTLGDEVATDALSRLIFGRFIYGRGATSLTLHAEGSDEVKTHFGPHDTVHVRVAFLMPCSIPIVSSLICTGRTSTLLAKIGIDVDEQATEIIEQTGYVESTTTRDLIFLMVPHLMLLTAEASMPIQGADYYPRDE